MEEKRKSTRYKKPYIVKFGLKDNVHKPFDVSQLYDISKGGLKFISHQNYGSGTKIVFYIRFPFLYPHETIVEGEIVANQEAFMGKMYKIGAKFVNITAEIAAVLEQMDQINQKNP